VLQSVPSWLMKTHARCHALYGRATKSNFSELNLSALPASYRGILAMTVAMALFTINDAFCKIVLREWPVGQVTFFRGLMMSIAIGALLLVWRQPDFLRTALHPGIIVRSLLDVIGTLSAFAALIYMTLANFAAVIMASPLILTLLAILIFREQVGWRRWLAIIVGLLGALIIVNPNPADFDPYSAFALLCALSAAARDLLTTRLHTRATTLTIIFVGAIMVMLGGFAKGYWETWQPLTPEHLLLMAGASVFLAGGSFFIVVAFRSAPIPTISPFRYTAMLWSPIIGYVAFHDIPDRRFLIGGALIVGAGLYALHRERVRHRYLASATPLPDAET
jgi:drug/metabolite transporter (DMT)-like permease